MSLAGPPAGRRDGLWLALIAALLYAPTLGFDFITEWDDGWLIADNPYLSAPAEGESWWRDRVLPSFDPRRPSYFWGAEFLPVRNLSYFVDRWLYGYRPAGWHASNVLLHALATWLLHGLLLRLLGDAPGSRLAALGGALIWALHPLHTETVCWVMGRRSRLMLVFALLAGRSWLAIERRTLLSGALPALWLAAAVLSKASALALPALLVALDLARGRPAGRGQRPLREALAPYVLPLLALGGVAWLTLGFSQASGQITGQAYGEGWAQRAAVAGALLARYAEVSLLPAWLGIPYPWTPVRLPASQLSEPRAMAGLALAALIVLGGGVWAARRLLAAWRGEALPAAPALAALVWWPAALLPALQLLLPIPRAFALRYAALSTLALALAAAALLRRLPPPRARLALSLLALLAAGLTVWRIPDWRDSGTLWRATVRNQPDNPEGHYRLGLHHQTAARELQGAERAERLRQAQASYQRCLALAADHAEALNNLGDLALRRGDRDAAWRYFLAATRSRQPIGVAFLNLARLSLREPGADLAQIKRWLDRALELNPNLDGYDLRRTVERHLHRR